MVRADWGSEYGASSLAICQLGGTEGKEGDELGSRGVGRHGAQDCAADSEDEQPDIDTHAMESSQVGAA